MEKQQRHTAEVTLSGRLFQLKKPVTGKAQPLTVDNVTDETCSRWLVHEATATSWCLTFLEHSVYLENWKFSLPHTFTRCPYWKWHATT